MPTSSTRSFVVGTKTVSPTKRPKRQSKHRTYKLILQSLRYALANREQLIRVAEIRLPTELQLAKKILPVQLMIEIPHFSDRGPITPKSVASFLESWALQETFLKWFGKQMAAHVPNTSPAMKKLKKSFMNLTVGREGKLPPQLLLAGQYKRLGVELAILHRRFPDLARLQLSEKRRRIVLDFGRESAALWCQCVSGGKISLEEIVRESPKSSAKQILAAQYDCTSECIHARLFRTG